MIDLHIHLDGSLTPEEVLRLADMTGVSLPARDAAGLRPCLTAPRDCASLDEYLTRFDVPLRVLQTPEAVEYAVCSLASRLRAQGLLYAEIRFAPQLHGVRGCSQHAVVEAAVRGLERSGLWGNLILCCMRGESSAGANRETLRTAGRFLGVGVAALDLAGAEALYPTGTFAPLFEEARRAGIPFTIHAGEAAGPESVRAALACGARRVGHGVRASEDPALLEDIRRRGVTLEMCPTSNFQTKAARSPTDYPLRRYLDLGLSVVLCTDNTTVSGTTLAREFAFAREALGVTPAQERTLLENAARAAFLGDADKEKLLRQIKNADR